MKRWSALYGYGVLISHGVTMRSAAQTDSYPRASARRAASARTALAALPEIGRKTPNFNARPALEMSASAHSIRGGPRDDHLPAIPPLDQEDAVADLARGHRVEQEPSIQRGRVETAGSAQQRLVLQVCLLLTPSTLSTLNFRPA